MVRFVVFALVVWVSPAVLADEPPPEVKQFFKDSAAARPEFLRLYLGKLAETEKQLAAIEQGTAGNGANGKSPDGGQAFLRLPSSEAQQETIDKLTERRKSLVDVLPALKNQTAWPLYSFKLPLKIGSIGAGGLKGKVERVINDDTFVARWRPLDDDGIPLWVAGQSSLGLTVGAKVVVGNRFELWQIRRTRMRGVNIYLELSRLSLETIRPFLKDGEIFVSYPSE